MSSPAEAIRVTFKYHRLLHKHIIIIIIIINNNNNNNKKTAKLKFIYKYWELKFSVVKMDS
jgi:hypothetical protein